MRHAFVDSGERRTSKAGRTYQVCSECGNINVGTAHFKGAVSTHVPHKQVSQLPIREIRMLALALDAVLALDIDAVGWRVHLRSNDLRSAITEVPRDPEQPTVTIPVYDPVEVNTKTHKAPVARARVATKGIGHPMMRELATRAIQQGWTLERTGSHFRLVKGTDHIVVSGTSSDHRAWRNMRALAKRKGIDVGDL